METPLPMEELDYHADGRPITNTLPKGSYIISPEKTAILYGGGEHPLSCVYSNDAGRTWETAVVSDWLIGIETRHVSFPDEQHGFVAATHERVMSTQLTEIFCTIDGGKTWQYVRQGPGEKAIHSFSFIDHQLGFISYESTFAGAGAESWFDLSRSEDGGVTWYTVRVDIPEDLQPFFTRGQAPFIEDGKLVLLIGEDPTSDYSGKHDHYLQYTSMDAGLTWQYEEIIRIEVFEPS